MKKTIAGLISMALVLTLVFGLTVASGAAEAGTAAQKTIEVRDSTNREKFEAVEVLNVKQVDNGSDSALVGSEKGGALTNVIDNNFKIAVDENFDSNYVSDAINGSKTNFHGNGAAVAPIVYGFDSPKGAQKTGATITYPVSNLGEVGFYLYADGAAAVSAASMTAQYQAEDDSWQELTVSYALNPTQPSGYKAHIFTATGLPASAQKVRFQFDKGAYANLEEYSFQFCYFTYVVKGDALYSRVSADDSLMPSVYVQPETNNELFYWSNSPEVSFTERGISHMFTADMTTNRKLGGIFTTNVSGLDFDISSFKFHFINRGDAIAADGASVQAAEFIDGPYTDVPVNLSDDSPKPSGSPAKVVTPKDIADIPAGTRYLKLSISLPDKPAKEYDKYAYQIWGVDFGSEIGADNSVTGHYVYRTNNLTDFSAQFNAKDGDEDLALVKFYGATANRPDDYFEIPATRSEGKVLSAAPGAGWTNYVFKPDEAVSLQKRVNYLKIVVNEPTSATMENFQFVALNYKYDNTKSLIDNMVTERPASVVRANGSVSVENDYEAPGIGGKFGWQGYLPELREDQSQQPFVVFRMDSFTNFRIYLSDDGAAALDDNNVRVSVASRDIESEYTEIRHVVQPGLKTTIWSNYVISPFDNRDIPSGSNYIKVSGDWFLVVLVETDTFGKLPVRTVITHDLDSANLTNMALSSGSIAVSDKTAPASFSFDAPSLSRFKLYTDCERGYDFSNASFYTVDEAGVKTPVSMRKIASGEKTAEKETFELRPEGEYLEDTKPVKIQVDIAQSDKIFSFYKLVTHCGVVASALPAVIDCPNGQYELLDDFSDREFIYSEPVNYINAELVSTTKIAYGYDNTSGTYVIKDDPDTDSLVDYEVDGYITRFDVRGIRITANRESNLIFLVSADGENWQLLDTVDEYFELQEGGRELLAYVCEDIPEGMRFLRVMFPTLESNDITEIGFNQVQIFYAKATEDETVLDPDIEDPEETIPETGMAFNIAVPVSAFAGLGAVVLFGRRKRKYS